VGICSTVHRDQFAAALVSAVLFGATFLGVGSLALALGAHLQFPRAVASLTTGYSIGQIIGPLIATPLQHQDYHNTPVPLALVEAKGTGQGVKIRVAVSSNRRNTGGVRELRWVMVGRVRRRRRRSGSSTRS